MLSYRFHTAGIPHYWNTTLSRGLIAFDFPCLRVGIPYRRLALLSCLIMAIFFVPLYHAVASSRCIIRTSVLLFCTAKQSHHFPSLFHGVRPFNHFAATEQRHISAS
jgi:hypothetical protein